MKKFFFPLLIAALSLFAQPVSSQDTDTTALGLAGDNLDLAGVLDLFQKSKTIEAFEKSLNEQKTGINNLDLDLDKKVDFIKVVTKQKDSSFTFILQVAVTEKETQDVAVILVDKNKGKVTMQIVGDEELYGKNYIIEPKPRETANPGYTGADPVVVNVQAPATTVIVEQAPIVQYVYSPAYVPYVPPYYYGYYPPYFAAFTVMAVGIYRSNHYYGYHGGYGGHYHNTTIINNGNNFNNYNGNRNRSDHVSHHNRNGSYNNGRGPNNRGQGGAGSSRPSAGTQPSRGGSGGGSGSSRPSAGTQPSNRGSGGASASTRPSTSNYSSGSGRSRSSSSYSGGGGGGMRSSGGGGGMRGGGGGGGRRR